MSQDDRQEGCFRAYLINPARSCQTRPLSKSYSRPFERAESRQSSTESGSNFRDIQAADEKSLPDRAWKAFWVICCSTDSA